MHTGNPLIGDVCLKEKLKHLLTDSMFLLRTPWVQRVEWGVRSGYKALVAVPHPLLAAWHRRIGDLVRSLSHVLHPRMRFPCQPVPRAGCTQVSGAGTTETASALFAAGLPVQPASGQRCGHHVLATSGGATPLPPHSGKVRWACSLGRRGFCGLGTCRKGQSSWGCVEWRSRGAAKCPQEAVGGLLGFVSCHLESVLGDGEQNESITAPPTSFFFFLVTVFLQKFLQMPVLSICIHLFTELKYLGRCSLPALPCPLLYEFLFLVCKLVLCGSRGRMVG